MRQHMYLPPARHRTPNLEWNPGVVRVAMEKPRPWQARLALLTKVPVDSRKICTGNYELAGAVCFPRRAMAAKMEPVSEPTKAVQPIQMVIWGKIPA